MALIKCPECNQEISYAADSFREATVTGRGRLFGRAIGTATLDATYSSGATASVDVKVVGMNRSSLTIRPYDTHTLWVNGFDSGVKWYAENPLIASVDKTGKVVGYKPGTTRIYGVVDGTRVTCTVRVTKLK